MTSERIASQRIGAVPSALLALALKSMFACAIAVALLIQVC